MQNIQLSKFDKRKLADAYMNLYNALVSRYQSKNMTCAESRHQAMREIKDILAKHKKSETKPAMDYLMEYHIAHDKNMIWTAQKNERTNIKDKTSVINELQSAMDEFENVISTVTCPDILVTLKNPTNPAPYAGSFFDWANALPDEQIELLENDPTEFARQYRRFALSRHAKEK